MFHNAQLFSKKSAPWGLKWRASVPFVTLVVGAGITTDVFFYALIIPVIPFRLEALGYDDPSSLTGFLLLAFAGGILISTPPIAWLSEHFNSRRTFLLIGMLGFIGAQILFMLSPAYAGMVVARILQGVSSTIIWTVGSALLCDTVPEDRIGQQFGIALMGLSFGSAIAPTVGGALYNSLGFRAPFIFSLGLLGFDLVLRFLVIERRHAMEWGFDPIAACFGGQPDRVDGESTSNRNMDASLEAEKTGPKTESTTTPNDYDQSSNNTKNEEERSLPLSIETEPSTPQRNSIQAILIMLRSKRAMAAALAVLVYGLCTGMLEATIPLRFQDVYGFSPLKVGLIYMAASFPTIISGTLAGISCDKHGTCLVTSVCFLLTLPWFLILAIRGPVALFIVAMILIFTFGGALPAPALAELDGVARSMNGIGFSHVYAVFNVAYAIGIGIGPLVGGQLYDHVHNGFTVIQGLASFLILLALGFAVSWMGDKPVFVQLRTKFAASSSS